MRSFILRRNLSHTLDRERFKTQNSRMFGVRPSLDIATAKAVAILNSILA